MSSSFSASPSWRPSCRRPERRPRPAMWPEVSPYFSSSASLGPTRCTCGDADALHRRGAVLAERLGHGAAQAADDGVLLGRDDPPGLLGRGDDRLDVERLEGGHVQDMGAQSPGPEHRGGLDRAAQHDARGHDGHVAALAHHHRRADPEVVGIVEDHGAGIAREAQVDGAVVFGDGEHRLAGLDAVARRHDGHVRHGPHDRGVFDGLMGLAALAHEQAAVAADDDDGQARLGDRDADLVERRLVAKQAKVLANGTKPMVASPAATLITFCS